MKDNKMNEPSNLQPERTRYFKMEVVGVGWEYKHLLTDSLKLITLEEAIQALKQINANETHVEYIEITYVGEIEK